MRSPLLCFYRKQRVQGGAGIVLDDVMAGIYAALVLYFAGWFNLY